MPPSIVKPETALGKPGRKHAIAAGALSFLVPGLGQAYLGKLTIAAAFAFPLPLGFVLVSRAELLDEFGGLVGWMLFQLCLMAAASIFAYRSGVKAVGDNPSSRISVLRRIAYVLAAGICVGVANYAAIAAASTRAFKIVAGSMEPTIIKGDRVIADLRFYSRHTMQLGDVVVVASSDGSLLAKRVGAMGGDSIQGAGGRIYVNGTLQQRYAPLDLRQIHLPDYMANFGPLSIPPGKIFLLGDNLGGSWDSRSPDFGLVDPQSVKGKIFYLYWSVDRSRIGKKVNYEK